MHDDQQNKTQEREREREEREREIDTIQKNRSWGRFYQAEAAKYWQGADTKRICVIVI